MDFEPNPWNVISLEAFHFYNCPECEDKYVTKEQFVCHATIVHAKAREALPGILQVENGIVISNVQSIIESDVCDDDANSGTDLESSICIEKVEPMSDVGIDENCDNSDIELLITTSENDDNEEDLSEYEKLRLKNIEERQSKFNELKIRDQVLDLSRNSEKTKRNVSNCDLSSALKEKDENCDTSNIEPPAATSDTQESDVSSIEPVLIKISKKEQTQADLQSKNRERNVRSPKTERKKKCKNDKKQVMDPLTKKYKCKHCKQDFCSKYYLTNHVQSAHEGVPFKCHHCSKTYASQGGLYLHIQSVHECVRFKCDQCQKTFTSSNGLHFHIQSLHEGVTYQCKHCEKVFAKKGYLKKHVISVHEGLTIKRDQQRSKTNDIKDVRNHIQTFHEGTTFKCDQCTKTYTSSIGLHSHIQSVHKGVTYQCDQCSKTYSSSNGLHFHIQSVHEGVKHQCEQCQKAFKHKHHLKNHVRLKHMHPK